MGGSWGVWRWARWWCYCVRDFGVFEKSGVAVLGFDVHGSGIHNSDQFSVVRLADEPSSILRGATRFLLRGRVVVSTGISV
jgi:hypothetical protein